jgi:hypothetical protein
LRCGGRGTPFDSNKLYRTVGGGATKTATIDASLRATQARPLQICEAALAALRVDDLDRASTSKPRTYRTCRRS